MLCSSEANKARIWLIKITYYLVFTPVSFVAAACGGVFMSNTGDPRIVGDGLGVFVPMRNGFPRWIDNLGFFPIICNTGFDFVLAYFAFCCGQMADWSCVDLEDPFFLCLWRTGEVVALATNVYLNT